MGGAGRLFGYRLEPDFDLAKDQRLTRVGWALYGGLIFWGIFLFWKPAAATEVMQGSVATILCYGDAFYVQRKAYLRQPWLWKAIIATAPLHIAYLSVLFWSDKAFPTVMTKAVTFMPVLLIAFALEAMFVDAVVKYFAPQYSD